MRPLHGRATWLAAGLGFSAILLVGGCAGMGPGSRAGARVRFESGIGREAFELRRSDDALRLVDADGIIRVEVRPRDDVLEILDGAGRLRGEVRAGRETTSPRGRFEWWPVEADRASVELKVESDGDLRIKGAGDRTLYKLKRRDYGFKVVDGKGETVARVRLSSSGKISVRDARNLTYLTTRDVIPLDVAAVLVVPGLDLDGATALAEAVWRWARSES